MVDEVDAASGSYGKNPTLGFYPETRDPNLGMQRTNRTVMREDHATIG